MDLRKQILSKLSDLKSSDLDVNQDYIITNVTDEDFSIIEQELNVSLPEDYKWFLSTVNALCIDGFSVNGVTTYTFEPQQKSYDIIDETNLFRETMKQLSPETDISNLLSLNTEDSDYLCLYNVQTNTVGIFSLVPEFYRIEDEKPFLKFIENTVEDYL